MKCKYAIRVILTIHGVHLKVNFHRFKDLYFDLDWAVCKILDSGFPRVIAGHKGKTIHPRRTTNLYFEISVVI